MDGSLIATTSNARYQALGTGGQLAVHAWSQIANHLQRRLGADYAALLAEPNPDADRGTTDWYAEGNGPARPLHELPEPAREAARAELTRLVEGIRAESEALRASGQSGNRFLGDLLALSLQVPDEDGIRVVEGRPVLVAWGHAPVGAPARPELLLGLLSRPTIQARTRAAGEPPMRIVGPPPPKPERRASRLWGLLVLLPLLLVALLWFDPFRWFEAPLPQCRVEPQDLALLDEFRREEAREGALRAEIARLAGQLGDRRLACPPLPAPRRTAISPPTPAPRNADAERAREQGARTGRVQIILAWDDQNDLDLMVTCPDGQRIFFRNRAACGGELDIDQNLGPPLTRSAVENIVFGATPRPGRYTVQVLHSQHWPPAPRVSPFRVTIRIEGQPDRTVPGSVAFQGQADVTSFEIAPR